MLAFVWTSRQTEITIGTAQVHMWACL